MIKDKICSLPSGTAFALLQRSHVIKCPITNPQRGVSHEIHHNIVYVFLNLLSLMVLCLQILVFVAK